MELTGFGVLDVSAATIEVSRGVVATMDISGAAGHGKRS